MTPATLVVGNTAAEREAAIAAVIDPSSDTALILEGLPAGTSSLDALTESAQLRIARIAPGCPCCTGNLTMRVTLNRILRHRPAHIFIGLATAGHLEAIRAFLTQAPYGDFLRLTKDLQA